MPVRLNVGDCVLVKTTPDNEDDKDNENDELAKQGIGLIKYIDIFMDKSVQ